MTDEHEQRLTGGNIDGAVRRGDTVRRRTGPWTPAVHELLAHLTAARLAAVPRAHGVDEHAREILDFLPGTVPDVDREVLTRGQLESASRWLRSFRETVACFRPGTRRWYFGERQLADDQIICHNDAAPYNMAFDGPDLVGVFDWDLAGPGQPLDDVAFFTWTATPLFRVVDGMSDRQLVARLDAIAAAYGSADVDGRRLADLALERMRTATERIAAGQRAGDAGMLALADVGEPERTRARIATAERRLDELAWHAPD